MAETINIKDIEERLKNRKIGTIDWYKFFSVAIPLIETDKGLSMLFEIRSSKLKTQPGDICFPGGRIEA
ncbi:MAG: CoA pyrophosphatase, partial [Firmicutes bacterium]|nr:CoA pyrophosphatase [Bacillota bacterium]